MRATIPPRRHRLKEKARRIKTQHELQAYLHLLTSNAQKMQAVVVADGIG